HTLLPILVTLGQVDDARAALHEILELARGLDYREVLAYALETAGELAHADGDHECAGRLPGASVAAFQTLGVAMGPEEEEGYARTIERLRSELGAPCVEELHATGEAAPFEESVGEALELVGA